MGDAAGVGTGLFDSQSQVQEKEGKKEKWLKVLQYIELQGDRLKFYKEKPNRLNRISEVSIFMLFFLVGKSFLIDSWALVYNIQEKRINRSQSA